MSDIGTFFLLVIALVLLALALSFFIRWGRRGAAPAKASGKQLRTQKTADGKTEFVRCPVCNTPLAKDENLVSRIFRPMTAPDQRMTVLGCPHCYPVAEAGVARSCPVCGKSVAADGYLVARLFNKPCKKHVIVTGCTGCLKVK